MVISAVGTPPSAAAVTVTLAGSGCAETPLGAGAVARDITVDGKADCRRMASRVSSCSVLTEDLPSVGGGVAALPGALAAVKRRVMSAR